MDITATSVQAITAANSARTGTSAAGGRRMVLAGRIISGFAALFLFMDGAGRLAGFAPYVEGTVQGGYPAHLAAPIGLSLVIAALLYVVPRTCVLGAIVLTGYLGGATATHVRLEEPNFLFAAAFGVLVWAGLYLRDARVRALLSLRA